jgi:hypothetical protein
MINYKLFKSNNCQSCEEQPKLANRRNQINNMNEIINSTKTTTNVSISNFDNLSKNKLFNNKITIEYFNNNTNNKGCPNC